MGETSSQTDFWRLTAAEIARRVRARETTARAVTDSALARLDAVNPAINAVVDRDAARSRAEADAVDAAIAAGRDPGPLAGVPVTIKVISDQAGFATTNGVTLQRDLIATENSPFVDNLLRAGAVTIGRTNTPAFSLRWFTANRLHGRTTNPHDPGLTPGGSSGGAAAGIAAGIGAIGHGTDIAGSIRYPAYACGLHGLRPSFGRVPAWNASGPARGIGAQLMAVSGPIARSIEDLRLGLDAMSAADPRDPWHVPAPLDIGPAPRRIALCRRPDSLAIAPEVNAALTAAADRLADAGWRIEEIDDVPSLAEATDIQVRLWLGDGYDTLAATIEREGDPGARAVIEAFRDAVATWPADRVSDALTRRAGLVRQWQLFLAKNPLVMLPVSAEPPFPDDLDLRDFRRVWRAQLTQIGLPVLGLPALTVATNAPDAPPMGIQITAPRFHDSWCLDAGEALTRGAAIAPIDPVPAA